MKLANFKLTFLALSLGLALVVKAGDDPRLNGAAPAPVADPTVAPPVIHIDREHETLILYQPPATLATSLAKATIDKIKDADQRAAYLKKTFKRVEDEGTVIATITKEDQKDDSRLDSREATFCRGWGWRGNVGYGYYGGGCNQYYWNVPYYASIGLNYVGYWAQPWCNFGYISYCPRTVCVRYDYAYGYAPGYGVNGGYIQNQPVVNGGPGVYESGGWSVYGNSI